MIPSPTTKDQIMLWRDALARNLRQAKHFEGKDQAAHAYYTSHADNMRRLLTAAGEKV